ncbi:DMT family transporter [Leptolyngbya sp. 7M]|uniref:DMT family transporter n=1 Tax=Leptolyngbya sp. 7M TaxID=2812896 RepID=UPI001B8ADA55|nr:DMT family transporter [Leptolyngbya sp. 7M]QYO65797.1 DMT family transporter [Leptolyngbya sp. 7M]
MREQSSPHPLLLVVIAVLLWSTGGLFIKLTSLDAYQVTFFRSFFAAVVVMIVTRKDGLKINTFGIFTSIIYAMLLFLFVWATKMTTAANAIFLQYTAPIYILILAPFLIGERFRFRDLLTVVVVLGGMSLFFVGKLEISDYQGNIAALFSGIFLGLYILLLRHPRAEGFNPAIAVIYGNLLLAILNAPAGISALPTMVFLDWFAVIFLGVFQIGISYILFIKGVRGGTRPLDASLIGFIEPLLNPVWVFIFIGERPAPWALVGAAIVISAIALHTLAVHRVFMRSSPT